jgi:hypothetical protein
MSGPIGGAAALSSAGEAPSRSARTSLYRRITGAGDARPIETHHDKGGIVKPDAIASEPTDAELARFRASVAEAVAARGIDLTAAQSEAQSCLQGAKARRCSIFWTSAR